jgi:hypothetical protein
LLLLTGAHDLDDLLQRIEWGTLLFFAALFILMEVGSARSEHRILPVVNDPPIAYQLPFLLPSPISVPSQALSELGLIAFIGNKTADLIKDVCHTLLATSQNFRAAGP